LRIRFAAGIATLLMLAACNGQSGTSTLPAGSQSGSVHRNAAAAPVATPTSQPTTFPTPFPTSTLLGHTPDGPHSFADLEGGTSGRLPIPYSVSVSGTYPPFVIDTQDSQIVAGRNVTFSVDNLTCTDNELDATGVQNGSSISAAVATAASGLSAKRMTRKAPAVTRVGSGYNFVFTLTLGPDNISPPTQFGCRFYFADAQLNLHRITMYSGGPTAHPMTISPSTIQLSGDYPFINAPSQTVTVSEPDPNNAFYFGRTGVTFDGAPLCSSVDAGLIGECRDAAPLTYDVNVAGGGVSTPPPHLLLQSCGAASNQCLTLTYSGMAPNPVGSVTTMMIYDASGDYAPLTVNW
jgi:hypothetical protein